MQNIICRNREQKILSKILSSSLAELAVVYGRRRVGKTFLLTEYFSSKDCQFFQVVGIKQGLMNEQLREFSKAIASCFYNNAKLATPNSWMEAFDELNKAISNFKPDKKIVILFDELPWMVTAKSRLLTALEYYWNRYWSKNINLKLFICGSSASWIIKKIINNTGGLHNRTTRKIIIKPFSLTETKQFLQAIGFKLSNSKILELYLALGGIPYYLINLDKDLSIKQNINQLCFNESGILFNEFQQLFHSLFKSAESYIEIIRLIASSLYGVARSDLKEKITLTSSGSRLSIKLDDLQAAGFIRAYTPISSNKRGIFYRLIDEYCYFYLKWIEPEQNMLLSQDEQYNYWPNKAKTPGFASWAGYAFETICYKHINTIAKALKIENIAYRVNPWKHQPTKHTENGAQIDLVFDRDDDAITLCEIKNTGQPYVLDKAEYQNHLRKIDIFKRVTNTKKQIFFAIISANGIKPTLYSEELVNAVVTLEDLLT